MWAQWGADAARCTRQLLTSALVQVDPKVSGALLPGGREGGLTNTSTLVTWHAAQLALWV